MKKFINIFISLVALVLASVSCEKEEIIVKETIDPAIVGEWRLTGVVAENTDVYKNVDIYLCINSDCSFELFQKSGTQSVRYSRYTGTCTSLNGVLSGVYSSGTPWGGKYTYTSSQEELVLKSYNMIEEQKYKRTSIPADIRENADTITRSTSSDFTPIL